MLYFVQSHSHLRIPYTVFRTNLSILIKLATHLYLYIDEYIYIYIYIILYYIYVFSILFFPEIPIVINYLIKKGSWAKLMFFFQYFIFPESP